MIPPIPPVPPVTATAPVDIGRAAAPVSSAQPSNDLVDRFSSIMQNLETSTRTHARVQGPSAISQFVAAEDHAAKATLESARGFSISDPQNIPQMATEIMHMQTEMAVLTFKLNVANGLASSGKSSIQTLMKNQ